VLRVFPRLHLLLLQCLLLRCSSCRWPLLLGHGLAARVLLLPRQQQLGGPRREVVWEMLPPLLLLLLVLLSGRAGAGGVLQPGPGRGPCWPEYGAAAGGPAAGTVPSNRCGVGGWVRALIGGCVKRQGSTTSQSAY